MNDDHPDIFKFSNFRIQFILLLASWKLAAAPNCWNASFPLITSYLQANELLPPPLGTKKLKEFHEITGLHVKTAQGVNPCLKLPIRCKVSVLSG
jgi:hypothetical protein